jgi:hypothetical protein
MASVLSTPSIDDGVVAHRAANEAALAGDVGVAPLRITKDRARRGFPYYCRGCRRRPAAAGTLIPANGAPTGPAYAHARGALAPPASVLTMANCVEIAPGDGFGEGLGR